MKNKNTTKLPSEHQHLKDSSRRGFLKKAAYTAPTIVALGALTKPIETKAAGFGKPPTGPTWS